MYSIQYGKRYEVFTSYRAAEIYCGENNIPCEYIVEEI